MARKLGVQTPLTMREGEADADRLAVRAGEALLWVADIVAGFVRAAKLGEPPYREILGERVIDFP